MGCYCREKQIKYFTNNCNKFTLLYKEKSYKRFLQQEWGKQNKIRIELITKIDGETKILTEIPNKDGTITIRNTIDVTKKELINDGIFENSLQDILSDQYKKQIQCVLIEEPLCNTDVDIDKIFKLIIKSVLDANMRITKTKWQQPESRMKLGKTVVLVYWSRISERKAKGLIETVLNQFQ